MLRLNWVVCVLVSAWCVSAQSALQTEDKPLVSRLLNVLQTSYTGKQSPEFYAARDQDDIDSKIVRLTDANYEELVVQGDKDTVWVVTVHEEKIVPSNQAFFDAHKNASLIFHNLTSGPSLEGTRGRDDQGRTVRFARVDYNAEWKVCTRWLIFKLVFITDNGKTLRFLDTSEIAPVGEGWAKWVKEGEWSVVQVWDGSFAPNGDMQWMIEKYIKLMDSTAKIRGLPPVVWMLVSGVIGRYLLEWLWGVKPTQTQTQAQARVGSTGKKSGDAGKRDASKKTQ